MVGGQGIPVLLYILQRPTLNCSSIVPHPTTTFLSYVPRPTIYILPRPTLDCSASGRMYNLNSSATRMDKQSSVGHGRMYIFYHRSVFYHLCKCTTYHAYPTTSYTRLFSYPTDCSFYYNHTSYYVLLPS